MFRVKISSESIPTMSKLVISRDMLIDKKLLAAGCDVKNLTQVIQELDISVPLPDGMEVPRTPYKGHQFSDYVLLGRDAKPLVVAKKTSKDAAIGRE